MVNLNKKKSRTLQTLKKILGIFLICLGIVGLVLPFLQGILLILIGIALLENKKINLYMKDLIKKSKKRFKKK